MSEGAKVAWFMGAWLVVVVGGGVTHNWLVNGGWWRIKFQWRRWRRAKKRKREALAKGEV